MNVIIPTTTSKYQDAINATTKLENITNKLLTTKEKDLVWASNKKFGINCDAIILTVLNEKFGFSAEQLKEFFNSVIDLQNTEIANNHDKMAHDYISQVQELKDNFDIDIIALHAEEES